MKRIWGVLIFVACLEGFGRLFALLSPLRLAPPYARLLGPTSAYPPEVTQVRGQTNRLGARAFLDLGRSPRIAFLGGSNILDSTLHQEDSWAERLGRQLGAHVENYGIDGAGASEVTEVAEHLAAQRRRFDLLLVMLRPNFPGEVRPAAFAYSASRASSSQWQIPFFWNHRLVPWAVSHLPDAWAREVDLPTDPRDPRNRELIASGKVQFADYYTDPQYLKDRFDQGVRGALPFFEVAPKVASRVVLVNSPIAYTEGAHPDALKRWFLLDPIPDRPGTFISFAAHARIRRLDYDAAREAARRQGVPILDMDAHFQKLLKQRGDLFQDHVHFSPAGARVAARWAAAQLRKRGLWKGIKTRPAPAPAVGGFPAGPGAEGSKVF